MSSNTGSYVLSTEDSKSSPSPYPGQNPNPSYVQQPQSTYAQPTQPLSYNQPTNTMHQASQFAPQNQNYPPSYAASPTPYSNTQGGEPFVSQQPLTQPGPVAQEEKKPMFTPETKERTKAFCAECGSSARWACGASLLITGCMCSFCGMLFSSV
jgi:hypothetical protein